MVIQKLSLRWLGLLFLVLLQSQLAQAAVSARTDRSQIQEGESLRLILRADEGEPQLNVLEKDFDILARSGSSQTRFINGRLERSREWVISLMPRRSGRLTIPAIDFGGERSPAIAISVKKAGSQLGGQQSGDIFIESTIEPKEAYVQQQLRYTVRFFQAVDVRNGSLSEPKIDNAIVERIGEDIRFQTRRNGRPYQVTERRYVLFPQASGELQVPATVFDGQILSEPDPRLGADPFNRLFQSTTARQVRLRSQTHTIQVKSQPPGFSAPWWLPAESFKLTETITPSNGDYRVGEPITRTLRMEAIGLAGSQLPPLQHPEIEQLKQYPDQAKVSDQDNGRSLLAVREEKIALVATQPGQYRLPAIRIAWWDSQQDIQRTATIAERTLLIRAADTVQDNGQTEVSAEPEMLASGPVAKPTTLSASYWPWLSGFLGLAWVVTLFGWWYSQRKDQTQQSNQRQDRQQEPNADSIRTQIQQACMNRQPAEVRRQLLNWAIAVWPDKPPRSLEDLAERLQDDDLASLFADLDNFLYAKETGHWDGDIFWQRLASHLTKQPEQQKDKPQGLPALYPNT